MRQRQSPCSASLLLFFAFLLASSCAVSRGPSEFDSDPPLDAESISSTVEAYNHWSDPGLELFVPDTEEPIADPVKQMNEFLALLDPACRVVTISGGKATTESPSGFFERIGRARFMWRITESVVSGPHVEIFGKSATVQMTKHVSVRSHDGWSGTRPRRVLSFRWLDSSRARGC